MINFKIFYWDTVPNFGDQCSKDIIQILMNKKINFINNRDQSDKFLCTGSILNTESVRNNDIIWGTGTMFPNTVIPQRIFKVLAVRGPLTRDNFIKSKKECPQLYCDPGILLGYLYKINKDEKKHELGIVPHHSFYNTMNDLYKDKYYIIDPRKDPKIVVQEIASCKRIISASLHGIIVAESLNIPTAYLYFKNELSKERNTFKYYDYYLGSNRKEEDIHINYFEDIKDFNINNIQYIKNGKFNIIELLKVFPYHIYNKNIFKEVKEYYGDLIQ